MGDEFRKGWVATEGPASRYFHGLTGFLQVTLLLGLLATEVLQSFLAWPSNLLQGAFGAACVLFGLPSLGRTGRILSLTFVALGALLLETSAASGVGPYHYLEAFAYFSDLVALLVVLPLISVAFETTGITRTITKSLQDIGRFVASRFLLVAGASSLFASMMLFSAVPLTYKVTDAMVDRADPRRGWLLGAGITQGYALALIVSPLSLLMAVTLSATGLSWLELLPYAGASALLGWLAMTLLSHLGALGRGREERGRRPGSSRDAAGPLRLQRASASGSVERVPGFATLAVAVVVMFGLFLALDLLTSWSSVTALMMTSLVFPLTWCVSRGSFREGTRAIVRETTAGLRSRIEQPILFLSVGFLTSAVGDGSLSTVVASGLERLQPYLPAQALILIIPVTVLSICFLGLAGVVTIAMLSNLVPVESYGASPEFVGLMYLVSGALSYILSPLSIITLVTSSLGRVPVPRLIGWNMNFALATIGLVWLFGTLVIH